MMVRGVGAAGRMGALVAGFKPDGDADNTGGAVVTTGGGTAGRAEASGAAVAVATGEALGVDGATKVGLTAAADAAVGAGDGVEGVAIFGAAAGTAGWVATAGAGVEGRAGGGATAGACCLRMAFRTSPGREIWERSILVLISSLSARLERDGFADPAASLALARKCARTLTAS
jgi:hypothetical protein